APQRSLQDPPRDEARPTAEARRAATPHISPRIEREARVDLRVRRRRRTGWIAWLMVAPTIAVVCWFVPPSVFDQIGWNPDARPTKIDPVASSVPPTAMPTPVASAAPDPTTTPVQPASSSGAGDP